MDDATIERKVGWFERWLERYSLKPAISAGVTGASVAAIFGFLLAYAEPNLYEASITVEFVPPYEAVSQAIALAEDKVLVATLPPILRPMDAEAERLFFATQFQILLSKETFYQMIKDLRLVERWANAESKADAFVQLLDKLDFEVPDDAPGFVTLTVRHHDPEEAAELALGLANAYETRRANQAKDWLETTLGMANAQEGLMVRMEENLRESKLELLEKFGIVDPWPERSGYVDTRPLVTQTNRVARARIAVATGQAGEEQLAEERAKLNEARLIHLDHLTRHSGYDEAKRKFLLFRKSRLALARWYSQAKIISDLPLTSIHIHEFPEPDTTSRKRALGSLVRGAAWAALKLG